MPRPATVRFYLDEDVRGLAKILAALRNDLTYPGDPGGTVRGRQRPACFITLGTKDSDWIPQVSAQGWLIITRDLAIQRHTAEIGAVRDSGARMVVLAGAAAGGTWDQLEIMMAQWRAIDQLTERPGPFIYAATRTTLRRLPL